MSERCPICQQMIGQSSPKHDGVCVAISGSLREHVSAIYQHRTETTLPANTDYNQLPFNMRDQDFVWRIRCFDAKWIQGQLNDQTRLKILEIGAWNGWLSHHLARAGHQVTAIEYSDHSTDGLGAKQHYDVDWHTIQMDAAVLSIFKTQFDVIIINHGLHYFPDPIEYVQTARSFLVPGGRLFLLNLIFYKNPAQRIQQIEQQSTAFEREHGYSHFLHPSRGYMDMQDHDDMVKMGLDVRSYPVMWRANLKARWKPAAPRYCYGILQVD